VSDVALRGFPVRDTFPPLYAASMQFLIYEAELLDEGRLAEWLELVADDIDYRVPTRVARAVGTGPEFSTASYHLFENRATLEARVARFASGYAVVENPPSRTRRIIGNVRVEAAGAGDEHAVRSNLLLVRVKGNGAAQLLSAERHDVLRTAERRLQLARRTVLLDHTVLPTEHLAIFL
jgi:3-phenylpropionate/cinnamic acid dioxygenase small subunit